MALKLYGLAMSTNTARAMICLHEKELDFELVPVNVFTAEHKQPPFLSKNPFGLIPVLEDGDLTLFESRAITAYVAEKLKETGADLIRHKDAKEGAMVKMWTEVESHYYEPAVSGIIYEYFVAPFEGKEPNKSVIDRNIEKLKEVLDVYETKLSSSKYLAGDFYSLADLSHVSETHYLMQTPCASMINERPHVKAWWEDISSRPAFTKVVGGMTFATMRVTASLYEKQLDFEFVHIDMKNGEHKKEPFILLNPFGQVPAFEDGDLKLFESRAISQYIVEEYYDKGSQLISKESKKMAIVRLWLEIESQHYDQAASKLVWELRIKPMYGIPTDTAAVEENEGKLGTVLDFYEKTLSKSKYLAGQCFTLADLHHLPTVHYLMTTRSKMLFESRPFVIAWVADITARPAWSKVIAMHATH
ncbi:Glutathione S-transferase F13 [Mucuna pruriens]|uniref:glutathione transferase n=1 Tax=Mucuna pruriens TaxID=157652 RepID=A0A371F9C3_MUCPR|nr:Glutathione S-transferase F13 [Mucuna pruriens]